MTSEQRPPVNNERPLFVGPKVVVHYSDCIWIEIECWSRKSTTNIFEPIFVMLYNFGKDVSRQRALYSLPVHLFVQSNSVIMNSRGTLIFVRYDRDSL
jgi:hypothetical protein